jgi:hypothetical protein
VLEFRGIDSVSTTRVSEWDKEGFVDPSADADGTDFVVSTLLKIAETVLEQRRDRDCCRFGAHDTAA